MTGETWRVAVRDHGSDRDRFVPVAGYVQGVGVALAVTERGLWARAAVVWGYDGAAWRYRFGVRA